MLTKHLQDDVLRPTLNTEDLKLEIMPNIVDNTDTIADFHPISKQKTKIKHKTSKTQIQHRKTRLEKVTSHLYDLEETHCQETCLNLDLDLYQMEDY